ncbi:MAG: ribonuclease PH, partial [Bdellovibrionales bacterium]|nr:ribonuclease PH [Bdellovibrionales bacterium]
MTRLDGRNFNQLRETSLTPHFIKHPEGSLLIATGNTKVICNVSIEASLPPWMKSEPNCGGWITAEYAMLPRSTHTRMKRETNGLKGRT